ncbi:MAG: hypothetical protein HYV35_02685 [Lentisphaerae bacterium]|nr:hypothetical protein [Lentisphaerota bacterium]
MNFSFGVAKPLYAKARHPRLLIGENDLPALRRLIHGAPGRTLAAAIRKKTEPCVRQILECRDLPALIERNQTCFWPHPQEWFLWTLHDMALLGRLEDRAELVEAVVRVFLALPGLPGKVGGSDQFYYLPPLFIPLAYDLIAEGLPQEDRARFAAWALERYIRPVLAAYRANYLKNAGGNGTIGAMQIALTTLLCITGEPGAPDLAAQREELLQWFEATLHTAIGPDGYPEEDTGYGNVVAGNLALVAEMVRRAGLYDVYRACPRFARYGRSMLHFALPWGDSLMATGDHGDQMRDREFVLARLAVETRDPALLWLLGSLSYAHNRTFIADFMPGFEFEVRLRKGFQAPPTALSLLTLNDMRGAAHPAKVGTPRAFRDRGRGIVSFRSGWDADATLAIFDGSQRSPSGQGHAHDSAGHFSIAALGEYFAIHAARYNIEQNCHNVVLVDGQSGRSTDGEWRMSYYHGLLIAYQPDPFCDFAAVDSSHQHNCYWARRYLGLVKGPGAPAYVWTVEDINKANDWAEFWWQLHTCPENTIALRGAEATITGWRHGNHLDVAFALPDPASFSPAHTLALAQDVATSSSYKYVSPPEHYVSRFARPADMVHGPVFMRPRLLAKVGGYNGRFMALMIPRRKGDQPAQVERLASLDNSLAVRITFRDVEDTLIFAYEHNLLEAGDVKGRGQWCVVRRARRSRRVLARTLGQGTALRAGGRHLAGR